PRTEPGLCRAICSRLGAGAAWAAVTLDEQRAIVSIGASFWRDAARREEVVSAIGSGDAFAAGLAAALTRGADVPQACRLAAACGAANAMNLPAGHARREDIERLLPQVSVAACEP